MSSSDVFFLSVKSLSNICFASTATCWENSSVAAKEQSKQLSKQLSTCIRRSPTSGYLMFEATTPRSTHKVQTCFKAGVSLNLLASCDIKVYADLVSSLPGPAAVMREMREIRAVMQAVRPSHGKAGSCLNTLLEMVSRGRSLAWT